MSHAATVKMNIVIKHACVGVNFSQVYGKQPSSAALYVILISVKPPDFRDCELAKSGFKLGNEPATPNSPTGLNLES